MSRRLLPVSNTFKYFISRELAISSIYQNPVEFYAFCCVSYRNEPVIYIVEIYSIHIKAESFVKAT